VKRFLFIVLGVLILFCGCSAGAVTEEAAELAATDEKPSKADVDESGEPAEPADAAQEGEAIEITVELCDAYPDFFENAAKKFEEQTGVKVNIIFEMYSDPFANADRIQAELMAGKGADMFAGYKLDAVALGEQKRLCDLQQWISQDSGFNDDTYVMNVVEAPMYEGKLYMLPIFFGCSSLSASIETPELEGQQNLSWAQFFETAKDVKRNGVLYGLSDYDIFMSRFRDSAASFVDTKAKKQTLNTDEMIRLLEQCKQWGEDGLCIPYEKANDYEMYENAYFRSGAGGAGILSLLNISYDALYEGEENAYIYDQPSDNTQINKANKIYPDFYVCINEASEHKEIVWQFIELLLSEEIQATGLTEIPVNRAALEKDIDSELVFAMESYKLELDPEETKREIFDTFDTMGKISSGISTPTLTIVIEEARRYYAGEVSAEDAAQSMADKVELYFKEQ